MFLYCTRYDTQECLLVLQRTARTYLGQAVSTSTASTLSALRVGVHLGLWHDGCDGARTVIKHETALRWVHLDHDALPRGGRGAQEKAQPQQQIQQDSIVLLYE